MLRQSEEHQRTEKEELSSQTHAMLNLNLQLQTSAVKNEFRLIELELKKFEAEQTLESLAIFKMYLSDSFFKNELDALQVLFCVKRAGFVCRLIENAIQDQVTFTPTGLVLKRSPTTKLSLDQQVKISKVQNVSFYLIRRNLHCQIQQLSLNMQIYCFNPVPQKCL